MHGFREKLGVHQHIARQQKRVPGDAKNWSIPFILF
jgi:hypothetical protein